MGAATSGIMGVAGAGTQAIAIVATAFGLAGQSYANWNSRLLLDVDHSTVQAVVFGRQQQYRTDNASLIGAVSDRPGAIYLLRQYLRLCMPITIETQINITATLVAKNTSESVIKAPLVQPVAVKGATTRITSPQSQLRSFSPAAYPVRGFTECDRRKENYVYETGHRSRGSERCRGRCDKGCFS